MRNFILQYIHRVSRNERVLTCPSCEKLSSIVKNIDKHLEILLHSLLGYFFVRSHWKATTQTRIGLALKLEYIGQFNLFLSSYVQNNIKIKPKIKKISLKKIKNNPRVYKIFSKIIKINPRIDFNFSRGDFDIIHMCIYIPSISSLNVIVIHSLGWASDHVFQDQTILISTVVPFFTETGQSQKI